MIPVKLTISGIAAMLYGIAIVLVLAALAIQTARIEGFKVWPISVTGYKQEAAELRAELKAISIKRNEQRETTKGNVAKAEKARVDADRVARRIEAAPLPGQCSTPPEILGADL